MQVCINKNVEWFGHKAVALWCQVGASPGAVPAAEEPGLLFLRELKLEGRAFSTPSRRGCVAALPSPGPCSPAVRGGSRRPGAPPGPGPCPCRRAVRCSVQSLPVTRWGSVPCALLLSLQLTDFNKENTAVCFLCALKLETCLVPTVPLEEVSIDVPGAGAAPSFARRGSAPGFPACRRGTLHQGLEGLARRPAVPRAGGGVRCPRRVRPRREGDEPGEGSEGCGRGDRLPRGPSGAGAAALTVPGCPGDARAGAGRSPRGAGQCPRSCPRAALGGSVCGAALRGSAGPAELPGSHASPPAALRQREELLRAGVPLTRRPQSSRGVLAARLALLSPPSGGGQEGSAGSRFPQRAPSLGVTVTWARGRLPEPSGGPGSGGGTGVPFFRVKTGAGSDSLPTLPPEKVPNDVALPVFRFKTIHYQFSCLRLKP